MIISQTPYRVSFSGGGTDLPSFYRHDYGAVLSLTLSQYMYVTVTRRFEPTTRVAYTRTEIAESVKEIQHTIVREALQMTDLGPHMEIVTVGDVPAGTGMGSSSALAVGLLNALYAFKGRISSRETLARQSCAIEIDILKKPIGKQDQYAAAYGGLNYIRFNPDESVDVQPVPTTADTMRELERRSLVLYTGRKRSADDILKKQNEATESKRRVLTSMRDLAAQMRDVLSGNGDVDEFARLLHEGWELKRSLGFGITDQELSDGYTRARAAGAQGGKLLGAGGGGFFLLLAPPERHDAIREALGRPREIPFRIDRLGSRIIFISG